MCSWKLGNLGGSIINNDQVNKAQEQVLIYLKAE